MANIESKLTTIRSATGGEDVRDAIIGALRDINNDVPADMSNPKQKEYNMPSGSDLTVSINPPELISQIIVRQPNTGGKSTTLNDITITENGEYPADDPNYDPNKENRYYDKVTVKVPQLANAVLDLEEEITQNGTYSAPADWGVDGIRTFTVNVSAATGDGPFTVEFYDKEMGDPSGKVIDRQLIPAYGSASCTKLDGTTDTSGRNFKGWNPSPTNITRDLKCYPVYGSYIIDPGEIDETWEQICADGGAHCPIGGYRNLIVSVVAQPDEVLATVKRTNGENNPWVRMIDATVKVLNPNSVIFNYPYYMVKVAEGEDGTHSTWISTGCATMPDITYRFYNEDFNFDEDTATMVQYSKRGYGNWPYAHCDDWSSCTIRQILNGKIFSSLEPALQQNIKQVTKYTRGLTEHNPNGTRVEIQTLDKIWIPSVKELNTVMSIARIGGAYQPNIYSEIAEVHGVDYASEYVPTWPDGAQSGGWWLRSMGYSGGDHNDTTATYVDWNNYGSGPELVINNYGSSSSGAYRRIPFGFCL